MKSMFTKSLIAVGVMTAAMNASAMTLTNATAPGAISPLTLSAEGVATDVVAFDADFSFAVNTETVINAGSEFTVKFTNSDLAVNGNLIAAATVTETGTSFTLSDVTVDTTNQEFTFTATSAIPAGSQFVFAATDIDLTDASEVTVSVVSPAGSLIESASATAAITVSQFAINAGTSFDNLIDRNDLTSFVSGNSDVATFSITNNTAASLLAQVTGQTATVVLTASNLDGYRGTGANGISLTNETIAASPAAGTPVTGTPAAASVGETVSFAVGAADMAVSRTYSIIANEAGTKNLNENSFSAVVTVLSGTTAIATKTLDLGSWELNAITINVPYLPVGFGLTPNIEIANAGTSDAEVQIRAFDDLGNAYPLTNIGKLAAGGTVTKLSESEIQDILGIPVTDKRKLSLTLVVAADAGDISVVPYYRQNESRVGVLSDQYKK